MAQAELFWALLRGAYPLKDLKKLNLNGFDWSSRSVCGKTVLVTYIESTVLGPVKRCKGALDSIEWLIRSGASVAQKCTGGESRICFSEEDDEREVDCKGRSAISFVDAWHEIRLGLWAWGQFPARFDVVLCGGLWLIDWPTHSSHSTESVHRRGHRRVVGKVSGGKGFAWLDHRNCWWAGDSTCSHGERGITCGHRFVAIAHEGRERPAHWDQRHVQQSCVTLPGDAWTGRLEHCWNILESLPSLSPSLSLSTSIYIYNYIYIYIYRQRIRQHQTSGLSLKRRPCSLKSLITTAG